MPKEMINVTIQRKQNEPWGMVIVGGKDQALTVKLGRIKVQNLAASLAWIAFLCWSFVQQCIVAIVHTGSNIHKETKCCLNGFKSRY